MDIVQTLLTAIDVFCKLQLFLQYQLFTLSTFFNLIKVYFFLQKFLLYVKKHNVLEGRELWILIYPHYVWYVPKLIGICLIRGLSQYRILLYISIYFLGIFSLFFSKKIVSITFISFFYEVSNFRNRILTNQKQEYVIKKCQSNCT